MVKWRVARDLRCALREKEKEITRERERYSEEKSVEVAHKRNDMQRRVALPPSLQRPSRTFALGLSRREKENVGARRRQNGGGRERERRERERNER